MASTLTGPIATYLLPYTSTPITPLSNNILASLCSVLYVIMVMSAGSYIRESLQQAEISRKFIHLCAASFLCFWPLFDATHWSWRLNVLVPVAMCLKLFYKGAILKDPNDPETMSMSRTSCPSELLYGPIHFTILMTWVGLNRFMTEPGIVIMSSMIGDGIAPLIGSKYGKHFYKMPLGNRKTFEGSLAVFGGTVLAIYFFSYVLGMEFMPLRRILALGVVASVSEGCAPGKFDNLAVAALIDFSFQTVKMKI